jgi:glyoxylase-like metal-dependent hydrolase (beta-lactamase superfamily II)
VPGLWRLRLPLAWAAIGHVNAFAIDAADGIVLVDCGCAGHPSQQEALSVALAEAGHAVEDVRILVGTHVHSDHIGLAQWVKERSGAELWMHPATGAFYDAMRDPAAVAAARERRARAEGVPEALIPEYRDVREETEGVLAPVEPDRPLHAGVRVPSALGDWETVETPGHSPSHVCLVQRDHGIAMLGDLVSAVYAPFFDYGYTPDPVAEFLDSLARVAAISELRVGLPGHGRPIDGLGDVLELHRRSAAERLAATEAAIEAGPAGAWELTARVFGEPPSGEIGVWRTGEVMGYLLHLRRAGTIVRDETAGGEFRYRPAARNPPTTISAISSASADDAASPAGRYQV